MQNTNDLAKKVWGKDATEVMDFLHKENSSIKGFFQSSFCFSFKLFNNSLETVTKMQFSHIP